MCVGLFSLRAQGGYGWLALDFLRYLWLRVGLRVMEFWVELGELVVGDVT